MKKILLVIVALFVVGSFLMSLMTTTEGDLLAAVIVLSGAAVGTIFTLKKQNENQSVSNLNGLLASTPQGKRKLYLIPLWIAAALLILSGFLHFQGTVIITSLGFVALAIYLYFMLC